MRHHSMSAGVVKAMRIWSAQRIAVAASRRASLRFILTKRVRNQFTDPGWNEGYVGLAGNSRTCKRVHATSAPSAYHLHLKSIQTQYADSSSQPRFSKTILIDVTVRLRVERSEISFCEGILPTAVHTVFQVLRLFSFLFNVAPWGPLFFCHDATFSDAELYKVDTSNLQVHM